MDFLNKHKRAFLAGGMILCLIAIYITANRDFHPSIITRAISRAILPLQTTASSVGNWVSGRISFFAEMNSLNRDNAVLRERIGQLEAENLRLRLAAEENIALSELLGVRMRYPELELVGATIIAWDPAPWNSSFTIDRGSMDGLERNMPVLGPGGLAGIIHEVYDAHSQVTSILDDRFAVAAVTVRAEDFGIARGSISLMQEGLMQMDIISASASIMPGDEIMTSGEGALFPRGIRIGSIQRVYPTLDGLAQYAFAVPSADINSLEHVQVVVSRP